MSTNRVYDPNVESLASRFPRFDVSDAVEMRNIIKAFLDALGASGIERMADANVEEIERTIPGPDGASDIPIRI
jgi:hypothetical protein